MPSHSDLEIKSRLVLGLGFLSLVVILLLRLLLPVLAFSGLGAAGYWLWRQQQKRKRRQQRHQARLNTKFYQLLRRQQGRVSVLDFAMHTRLDGTAAQVYLNNQAQAFSACFETTLRGDIIYVFNVAAVHGNSPHYPPSPAEAAWAYAEGPYAAKAYGAKAREETQAAWANAKQIRTLRQLSQRASTGSEPDSVVTIEVPAVRG